MIDLRTIDELTRKLGDSLPPGLIQKKEELENQFRTVLTAGFERMNLVGREEFDRKCAQLEETRAMLADLKQRMETLDSN
jgi:hypothetical protein